MDGVLTREVSTVDNKELIQNISLIFMSLFIIVFSYIYVYLTGYAIPNGWIKIQSCSFTICKILKAGRLRHQTINFLQEQKQGKKISFIHSVNTIEY